MNHLRLLSLAALIPAAYAQTGANRNPFPQSIAATEGVIAVSFTEFASIPDSPGGTQFARPMLLVDEPGSRRLFVNDMAGPLYSVSYDGKSVSLYVNLNDPKWSVPVQSQGAERG